MASDQPSVIRGKQHFLDDCSFAVIVLPSSCITNTMIAAAAAIDATKLEQQYTPEYAQPSGQPAYAETKKLHTTYAAGDVIAFEAGSVLPNLDGATVDVDLQVDGASILTAAVELDDTHTAYEIVSGTIDTEDIAAGKVLTVVITPTPGTGSCAQGVFCRAIVREAAE